jgi:Lamin-B receptor of TUDOR domain
VSALANALTEYPVGTKMARLFKANNVEEYYSGRVTGFDIKKKWYRVIYDDGDAEELSRSELRKAIFDYQEQFVTQR